MAFSYKRSLTIDHTQCGSSDSSSFPVLVKISDATFKTVGNGGHVQNSNGYDIAFYSDSGLTSPLFWEIDSYDGTGGVLWAWVKVPTVSHTSDTVIYVGYGDAGISTFQSTASSVWDSNYKGVWHLGETSGNYNDSTTNGNNSSAITITTRGATAQISKGAGATGSNDLISVGVSNLPQGQIGVGTTFSGWVNSSSWGSGYRAMLRGDGAIPVGVYIKSGQVDFYNNGDNVVSGTTLSSSTWYYITVTSAGNGGTATIYINGVSNATGTQSGSWGALSTMKLCGDSFSQPLNGICDEIRISGGIARSADWNLTEYNNQSSPSTFITVGSETSITSGRLFRMGGLDGLGPVGQQQFNPTL